MRSADRYAAVEKLMADHGFSERRACRLVGVNRSAWQYEPLRGKDDAVRERMREIAKSVVGSATVGWRSCCDVRARA
jgi:putative transposase